MIRKIKTHIPYKKDGLVIRPAGVCEEYDIGNWASSYSILKMGYEESSVEMKYSDITYVMTLNKSIIGYFMAYNIVNIGENPNIPLYSKEMVVYDFAVAMRAYAKYSKILMDYIISYANYNGYKAISFYKVEEYHFFNKFLIKNYDVKEIDDKYYIFNENPRIRSCQKHLTLYENDRVRLEDLYFLYDLKFDINKTKCSLKLNDNAKITVDRLTGIITFPEHVKLMQDEVILNNKTWSLVDIILEMYLKKEIKNIEVSYDANNPYYYEALVDDLLHISKTHYEMIKDSSYVDSLIQRGYSKVFPNGFSYDMNGSSFHYAQAIYNLKKL